VIKRFRKRPVVVEAIYNASTKASRDAIMRFVSGSGTQCIEAADHNFYFDIPTPEGIMTCQPGDWIIKGTEGEFYPCKPGAFAATFEAVL
jgi:hypothetical protein